MNKFVCIDTNVLIYAKDKRSIYHKWALDVFNSDYELATTSKNLSEFYAVLTKGVDAWLSSKEALEDINKYKDVLTILYPTPGSWNLLTTMINKYQPKGLKVHDFEIAAIALEHWYFNIATINRKDFSQVEGINLLPLTH